MAYELFDSNFDNDLKIKDAENFTLVIGYTNECPRSRKMQNDLNEKNISYGEVNLRNNQMFLRKIALKLNLTSINMPLVLLFKDGEYTKRLSNSLPTAKILMEMVKL